MREFKLDFVFRADARATYEALHEIHQADIDRRVDFLCQHPEADYQWTFEWEEDGPNHHIFYDDVWLITYAIVDEWPVVEIWSMAPAGLLR